MKILKTAESVMAGHPDKICDQISDAVLDRLLELDPNSRVAINAAIKNYTIFLFGEITTTAIINYDFFNSIVYNVLRKIGLVKDDKCDYKVILTISAQSSNIARGVNIGGAGDQGTVYGYATNETKEYLPLPVVLAHRILYYISTNTEFYKMSYGPDGKCQVTLDYSNPTYPRIDSIVLSIQHPDFEMPFEFLNFESIMKSIVKSAISDIKNEVDELDISEYKFYLNNAGPFVIGSSFGDSGLTGRKIVVDTYGPSQPHGGGAFSGKDPTKLDRSGAYAARWLAKNIVAAELADECGIEISYVIGKAEPVALSITGTNFKVNIGNLQDFLLKQFPLTPAWIIETLKLRQPIYRQTAVFGHFGRKDLDLPWEQLDLVDVLKKEFRK